MEHDEKCNLCQETSLDVGESSSYGAVVICKVGSETDNMWLATLSPKTGGDPENDCTIQLMPHHHYTNFTEVNTNSELAKNYGLLFAKVSNALFQVMKDQDSEFTDPSPTRESSISIASYGKWTTWNEKKEHLHIKIFPFRNNIGQPYTVDSSFGRKEVHTDTETNEKFVKMDVVEKTMIKSELFTTLKDTLILLLNE
ncbi:hypothetical protein HOL21_03345 [Candidatus Woesearchaeota archaeon]|jgi:hypothetical protein|nr:hypothetical protein [Candidatus Woesearchaeota archaeon]MBT5397221.1 hypothetical protein [Candidatus Woesearchaeota archaeon]MBT5924422.1 hypothetical protein [Candidatus Woesearchaeota archaeon]MBT6367233.1 hypothetical protein [Candidatus Woesearchaeota archaeon]MBT7762621.1 hypothetical protein [Candidatus Woesearchaeota archaeon]